MTTHLATVLWAALAAIGLLAPERQLGRVGTLPDWAPAAAHVCLFLGLALSLRRSLAAAGGGPLVRRPPVAAFVAAMLYGLILELGQIGIEGRHFDGWDLVLNGLGALAGVAAAGFLARGSDRTR